MAQNLSHQLKEIYVKDNCKHAKAKIFSIIEHLPEELKVALMVM